MDLWTIAPGDTVHCRVNGRVFTAQAVAREGGMLTIAPPDGVTAYRVTAREVIGHEPARTVSAIADRRRGALATQIDRAGGLATVADLARRLGVNTARMHELSRQPGFPRPVAHVSRGRTAVYAVAEVDAWAAVRQAAA
jgi:hypothetical protein